MVSNERRVISRRSQSFKGECRELTTNALSMRGNHKYIRGGAEKFNRDITKILQPPMGDK